MLKFEGMTRQDSLDLLEKVLSHGTSDSQVYRHKWQPDDFVIWANRRLIHTAAPGTAGMDKEAQYLYHLVFVNSNEPVHAADATASMQGSPVHS